MHNPASVLENDTHELLWDVNIKINPLFSARRPDLIIINNKKKRSCKIVDFAVPPDRRIKLGEKNEKKDKYLDLAIGKNGEQESDYHTNRDWCFCDSHHRIIKGSGGFGNIENG